MNFKNRGFTVGDFLILLIMALFFIFIFNKYKVDKNNKQISSFNSLEFMLSNNT